MIFVRPSFCYLDDCSADTNPATEMNRGLRGYGSGCRCSSFCLYFLAFSESPLYSARSSGKKMEGKKIDMGVARFSKSIAV